MSTCLILLAIASICLSFTYAVEENCEEEVSIFRAVSKDGGGDGDFNGFCPDDDVLTSVKVIIHDNYVDGVVPAGCENDIYLYAYLAEDFSYKVGVANLTGFTDHSYQDLSVANVPIVVNLSEYEYQICSWLGTDQLVSIKFTLVYLENDAYHILPQCEGYFPSSIFESQSTSVAINEWLDCGCDNDGPEPTNPTGRDRLNPGGGDGGDTYQSSDYDNNPNGTPNNSNLPFQSSTTYTDFFTDKPQQLSSREKLNVQGLETATLYPNPFQEEIKLNINSESTQTMDVRIYNNQGQLMLRHALSLQKGQQVYSLPTTNLPIGAYWIKLQSPEESLSLKMIKTR